MKTKEELNDIKEEVVTLNRKLADLTDEELAQVVSGYFIHIPGRLYWKNKEKGNASKGTTDHE